MSETLKIVLLTACIWELPFMIGAYLIKRHTDAGFRVASISLVGGLVWALFWTIYVGWWISKHLCY